MVLRQFERQLERLVEGTFAKAFRSNLHPVEIARRLVREIDRARTLGVRGTITANRYTIAVSVEDHERLSQFEDALIRDLSELVRAHAREEGYQFVGPVDVLLDVNPRMKAGDLRIHGEIFEDPGGPIGSIVLADGTRIRLGHEPTVIGRLSECTITIADPQVSRQHAEIRRERDDFRLVDLGSTNGTTVNGTVVREVQLRDGDRIGFGTSVVVTFEAS